MVAHRGRIPAVPGPARHFGNRTAFLVFLLFYLAFLSAGGSAKGVRVKVSEEDIRRANQASQEGDIAFGRKDYYAALIKYLEVSRTNPNHENIYNKLGITYSQLKLYDEAAQAFQLAIKMNPKYAYSVNNLGTVHFARRDLKKAEKYFKKAISMRSGEASFHMNLGSVYFDKKKYDKALVEWRKAIALDPSILTKSNSISLSASSDTTTPMERRYFIARLYASSGDVEKAIESLQQALLEGFTDIDAIRKQPDFDPIRKDERFIEFMKTFALLISTRPAAPVKQQ
jgi:tetratricopeptide (TPR) repeat protein